MSEIKNNFFLSSQREKLYLYANDYHFDSMANKEIVQLVESVLANHREDAKDPAALNDLVTILDIFTDAGWPEALNLVWRLDEIFR
jgi:hypothetical protein